MSKMRALPAALAAAFALALAACAATPGGEAGMEAEAAGDRISVEVNNDLVPGTTIVVWLVPETGSRRRLGSVPPNGRQTFTYLPTSRSMDHRLVAERAEGGQDTSRSFTLVGVSRVQWQVSGPEVRVVR